MTYGVGKGEGRRRRDEDAGEPAVADTCRQAPYEPPTLSVIGRVAELTLELKISGTPDGMSNFFG